MAEKVDPNRTSTHLPRAGGEVDAAPHHVARTGQ